MKNVWTMAREAMNDDVATAMLGNVLRVYEKVDLDAYAFHKDDVRVACFGELIRRGWVYDEFRMCRQIPAFDQWFDAVVDEIWRVNFGPKVTKAA